MSVIIGQPRNEISLNGKEYLLDNEHKLLKFDNEKDARQYLYEHGLTDKHIEDLGITFDVYKG